MKNITLKKGFGLVEILIVTAIIAIGFMSVVSFLLFNRGASLLLARTTTATSLAEEGMEAVRAVRDENWSAVASTGTFYPLVSGGKWTLSNSNPGLLNNFFTRTVVIANVNRDANDDIATSGTNDPDTRKVTVTVSWQERGTKQVVLTAYITNFR